VAALHKTETIDYDVLIDGQLDLVLEAEEFRLEPGDCVVIPNVKHGWHAGPDGATLIVFAVGV
jgi:quercetin dioxygenase-like cupin family protein